MHKMKILLIGAVPFFICATAPAAFATSSDKAPSSPQSVEGGSAPVNDTEQAEETQIVQNLSTKYRQRWMKRIQENYPSRALRENHQGTVYLRVDVTPIVYENGSVSGRATDCKVVSSSGGSPVLNEAACRGMLRYARFSPAIDTNGNPVGGQYFDKVVYSLETKPLGERDEFGGAPELANRGVVSVAVKIDADGLVADCTVARTSGFAEFDHRGCERVMSQAPYTPSTDKEGNPIAVEKVRDIHIFVE